MIYTALQTHCCLSVIIANNSNSGQDTFVIAYEKILGIIAFKVSWVGRGVHSNGLWYEKISVSDTPIQFFGEPNCVISPESNTELSGSPDCVLTDKSIVDYAIIISHISSSEYKKAKYTSFTRNWHVHQQDGLYSLPSLDRDMFAIYMDS